MTGDGQSYNWGKVSMEYKSVIRRKHLSLPPHKLMEGLLWMKNTNKGITTAYCCGTLCGSMSQDETI